MNRVHITSDEAGLRLALADGRASLRLVPRLGLRLPRYHFRLGRVVHAAAELGLFRLQTTLLLGNDHTGRAELTELHCAAGLDADAQALALGQLIAAAQGQLRERPQDFGDALVAELPGWRDAAGQSPFWQALGARFYAGSPAEAESRVLSAADAARPALAALRAAGFQPPEHARIDDGGPVLVWPVPGR
jgi:arginine/ornithine N-succinyltransferase beta subunit